MICNYLKEAGYVTAAIGKWHVGGAKFGPLEHGFDMYHSGKANTTPSATEGGKGFVYEGGLRVPLIVRWPGHMRAGRVTDDPVINTDWVPTLLEMIGQPIPRGLDGVSFASFLAGRGPVPVRTLFWHFPHYTNQGSRPSGAVRDGNWMMVEYYDEEKAELYDLRQDVSETQDVAASQAERVSRMRAALPARCRDVRAPSNTPNPVFDPVKYRQLYVDADASRFDPVKADQAEWEKCGSGARKWTRSSPEQRADKVARRSSLLPLCGLSLVQNVVTCSDFTHVIPAMW